jgi:hypothetical protein
MVFSQALPGLPRKQPRGEGNMSKLIGFLEHVGQDAQLRYATKEALESALVNAGLAADVSAAILADEHDRLAMLAGATKPACCCLSPDEDDDADESGEDEIVSRIHDAA